MDLDELCSTASHAAVCSANLEHKKRRPVSKPHTLKRFGDDHPVQKTNAHSLYAPKISLVFGHDVGHGCNVGISAR
jgi:hypothetical protein